MNVLALLQPTGAKATVSSGSTQSTGVANGAGGFEQLLLGLLTPGLAAPQGTPRLATGAVGAAKTAAGAVGLLASSTGKQSAVALVKAGGTALTGAAVLGVDKILPTARNGAQILPETGPQAAPAPTGSYTSPITAALNGVKSATALSVAASAAGKTVAGKTAVGETASRAAPTQGGVPATLKRPPAILTATTKNQTLTGSPKAQGAAAPAAGSAVTAVLGGKTATPAEAAKKPVSLTGGSSVVVTAKQTIKSAVIDAPGAGKKTAKPTAKTAGSRARGSKTGSSARPAPQAQNGPTVAQAAQAAAKANLARPEPASSRVQTAELFVPTATSVVSAIGEGGTVVLVSSIAGSTGAEPAAHTAAARAAAPFTHVPQQIAVQFSQALAQGTERISIQLQPQSLGRVDVEIELTKDGRLSAVFIAERPETLEMLQRDSRALERALNEAGVRTDADGFSFSLRGEGRHAQQFNTSLGGSGGGGQIGEIETEELLTPRGPILNANALLDIQV